MTSKRRFLQFSFKVLFFTLLKINWTAHAIEKLFSKRKTLVLTHPIFFNKIFSNDHPEQPERIKKTINGLKEIKLENLIETIHLDISVDHWVNQIHSKIHINSLTKNFSLAESISRVALKGCIQAIDKIMTKEIKNAFCLSRPPGHHALNTGKDEGFCFYNHIAVAAKYIQLKHKKKKILIIDWDYHHGNSTELFFYDDPTVLCFSTHNLEAYPGTGFPERTGVGKGKGFNINIHLPCGTTDQDIIKVYENILIKKANLFKPDFVLVSAGFDSRKNDPLGCFEISDLGFKKLTEIVLKIAHKHCDGRLLSILEGGYNIEGNAKAVISHIKVLNNFYKKV